MLPFSSREMTHLSIAWLLGFLLMTQPLSVWGGEDNVIGSQMQTYHLPPCHRGSIYFAPRSAELGPSSWTCVVDIAAQLGARKSLQLKLEGLADAETEGDGSGSEESTQALRAMRAETVAGALRELGVSNQSILETVGKIEPGEAPCFTEICRQSSRRVAVHYIHNASATLTRQTK